MKNILHPAFVLALALTAACGDESPTETTYPSGSLSFSYASENSPLSGNFAAVGAISEDADNENWAAAVRQNGGAVMMGNEVSGSAESVAIVSLPNAAAGNTPVTEECDTACASVSFLLEKTVGGVTRSYMCDMTSGTISVSTLSASRVKGTFSGTGYCSSLEDDNAPTITITNGAFDTPVVLSPIIGD